MNKIPFAHGRAAGVAAQEFKTEPSFENSARGQAVFAGLVVAKRGKPFTVLNINADNYLQKLGDPIHPRTSEQFEPIRHIAQAVNGGRGYVVRVVPVDMKIPLLRFKETTTPPAPITSLVYVPNSVLTTSGHILRANGTDSLTLAFTARGADGSLLTGLKNVNFKAIGQHPPTFGDVYEINGTYYVDMTATRSDSQIVLVLDGGTQLGQFSVNIQITPAIVDASRSTITVDKVVIDNDGKDKATVTFKAVDQDGNIVSGMTNIDFMVQGPVNVLLDRVNESAPGVYETQLSGVIAGSVTVRPRQSGKILNPLGVDVQLVDVISGVPIDPSLSALEVQPQDIYSDGKDPSQVTFTAHDAQGRLIKGITNLSLSLTGITGFTLPPFVEVSSGVYQTTLTSTGVGTATLTPKEGSTPLTNLKQTVDVLLFVPIDESKTTITLSRRRILNNHSDMTTVTLNVFDAQGNPIKSPPGISFKEDGNHAVIGAISEVKPGELSVNITSDYTGKLHIKPFQYSKHIDSLDVEIVSAPAPVLDFSSSRLSLLNGVSDIQANGTDTVTAIFEARDQVNEPMSGLNLAFVVNGITSGITLTPQPEQNGVYTATITGTDIGSGTITMVLDGKPLGSYSRLLNIKPVRGKIDWDKSSFFLSSASVKANDRDKITGTITLADGYYSPVIGYSKLGSGARGLASVNMTPVVEVGGGVYTFEISSLSDGIAQISVLDNTVEVTDPDFTKPLQFILVRGIIDTGVSTFTVTPDEIFDDGNASVTATFAAIDNLNLPVRGLTDITFDLSNASGAVASGPVIETAAGVYAQTFTSQTIGTFTITPEKNFTPIGTFSKAVTVKAAPVIDRNTSGFLSRGSLVADDRQTMQLYLTLVDQYGDPFDRTGITLQMDNLPGVVISAPQQRTPTIWQYDVAGDTAFTADGTVTVMRNGQPLSGIPVVRFHVNPVPGVIDGSLSGLFVMPNAIKADGREQARVVLEAKDGYGDPVTGKASEITFTSTIAGKGVVFGATRETVAGTYEATFTSRKAGTALFSANRSGKAVTGLTPPSLLLHDVTGIPYMADSSFSSDIHVGNIIYDQGTQTFQLTFRLVDALGNVIPSQAVTMEANDAGVGFSQAFEYTPGEYTFEVSAQSPAAVIVKPVVKGTTYDSPTFEFNAISSPTLTDIVSELTRSPQSAIADGSSAITVTFTARDQYLQPVTGLTGLELVGAGLPNLVGLSSFTDNQDGTYTTDIKCSTVGTTSLGIEHNGVALNVAAVDLEFSPVPGIIEPGRSSLGISKSKISGDGVDSATVMFIPVDGLGNSIPGLTNIRFSLNNLTGASFGPGNGLATETSPGTYTATITSQTAAKGTITVKNGSAPIGVLSAPLEVSDMTGLLNGGHSHLTLGKTSIQAMMADRIFTPADGSVYVTEVVFRAEDIFDQPITGIPFGGNQALLFVETSGKVPVTFDYRGESSPGVYHAYARTSTPGAAVIDVQYNNALLTGVPGVPLTVTAAPTIDWDKSTLVPEVATVETDARNEVALTFNPVDTNGDAVTGLLSNAFAIELKSGSLTAAEQTLTGLARFTPLAAATISSYQVKVRLSNSAITKQYDPVYVVSWKGKQQAKPTATFALQPKRGVLNIPKSSFTVTDPEVLDDNIDSTSVVFNPRDWYGTPVTNLSTGDVSFSLSGLTGAAFGSMSRTTDSSGNVSFTSQLKTTEDGTVKVGLLIKGVEVMDASHKLSILSKDPVYPALNTMFSGLRLSPSSLQIGTGGTSYTANITAYGDGFRALTGVKNLELRATPAIVTPHAKITEGTIPGTYSATLDINNTGSGDFTVEIIQGGKPTGITARATLLPAEKMAGPASTWVLSKNKVLAADTTDHIDVEFHAVASDGKPASGSTRMVIKADDPVATVSTPTETSPGVYSARITWAKPLTIGNLLITAEQAGVRVGGATTVKVAAYPSVEPLACYFTISPANDQPIADGTDELHVIATMIDTDGNPIVNLPDLVTIQVSSFSGLSLARKEEDTTTPGTYHFYYTSTVKGTGKLQLVYNTQPLTWQLSFAFLDLFGFDPSTARLTLSDKTLNKVATSGPVSHTYSATFMPFMPVNRSFDLTKHSVRFTDSSGKLTLSNVVIAATYATVDITSSTVNRDITSTLTVDVDAHTIPGISGTLSLKAVTVADLIDPGRCSLEVAGTNGKYGTSASIPNNGTTATVRFTLRDSSNALVDVSRLQALGAAVSFTEVANGLTFGPSNFTGSTISATVKAKTPGPADTFTIRLSINGAVFGTLSATLNMMATDYAKTQTDHALTAFMASKVSFADAQAVSTLALRTYQSAYVKAALLDTFGTPFNLAGHAVEIREASGKMTVTDLTTSNNVVQAKITTPPDRPGDFTSVLTIWVDGFQLMTPRITLNVTRGVDVSRLGESIFGAGLSLTSPDYDNPPSGLDASQTVYFVFNAFLPGPAGSTQLSSAVPLGLDFTTDLDTVELRDSKGQLVFTPVVIVKREEQLAWSAVAANNIDIDTEVYVYIDGDKVPDPFIHIQMAKADPLATAYLNSKLAVSSAGTVLNDSDLNTSDGAPLMVRFEPKARDGSAIDMTGLDVRIVDTKGILSAATTVNHGTWLEVNLAKLPEGYYSTTISVLHDGKELGGSVHFELNIVPGSHGTVYADPRMSNTSVAPTVAVGGYVSMGYTSLSKDASWITFPPGTALALYTSPDGGYDLSPPQQDSTLSHLWMPTDAVIAKKVGTYRVGAKSSTGRYLTDPLLMPIGRVVSKLSPVKAVEIVPSYKIDAANSFLAFLHEGTIYKGEEYYIALHGNDASGGNFSIFGAVTDDDTKIIGSGSFASSLVPFGEVSSGAFTALFKIRFNSSGQQSLHPMLYNVDLPDISLSVNVAAMPYGLVPASSSLVFEGGSTEGVLAIGGQVDITINLSSSYSLSPANLVVQDSMGILTFGPVTKSGTAFKVTARPKADAEVGERTWVYVSYAKIPLKSVRGTVEIGSALLANAVQYPYLMWKCQPGTANAGDLYSRAYLPAGEEAVLSFIAKVISPRYQFVTPSSLATNLYFKDALGQISISTVNDGRDSYEIGCTAKNPDGGAFSRIYPVFDGVENPECSFTLIIAPEKSLTGYFYANLSRVLIRTYDWPTSSIVPLAGGRSLTFQVGLSDSKGSFLGQSLGAFIQFRDSANILTFSTPVVEVDGTISVTATAKSVPRNLMTDVYPVFTYPTEIVIPELARSVKVTSTSGAYDDYDPVASGSAVLGLISKSQSSFAASKAAVTGDGEEIELTFVARKADGDPLPGLALEFRPGNPLLEIGAVLDNGFGTYTATAHAHSFDYATTVEVVNGGVGTGIKLVVDVAAQQLVDDRADTLKPIASLRSPNSLYPIVAPADGKSELVATLNLKDAAGEPLAGAEVVLVAMHGSADVTVSKVTETAPGKYVGTFTSQTSGGVIVGWYANGMYIKGEQRGAFSAIQPDALIAEHPPKQVRAATGTNPAVVVPTFINVTPGTVGPEDEIALEADDLMVIYADDGDASTNRLIDIQPDPTYSDLWVLTLSEVNALGVITTLEMVRFSLDSNSTDYAGLPAWLPYQLEKTGSRLRAVVKNGAVLPSTFHGVQEIYFEGGSDGTLANLTADDYRKALEALEASAVNYTAMLGLGIYDQSVLRMLALHSYDRRIDMFCDAPPSDDPINALAFTAGLGFSNYPHVAVYHFPYSSRDIYTNDQVVFGLSGDVFVAKARGVVLVPEVGGWHYSPAGMGRGTIMRRNITPLAGAEGIDREEYVRLRLNTVAPAVDGNMQIDDSLTTYLHQDGQQYQHVSSVLNALARDINDICTVIKHEPGNHPEADLTRELGMLFNAYARAGALVPPRDPDQGLVAYTFNVVNSGFDSWTIQYAVCVVGTARRISCEPIMYR